MTKLQMIIAIGLLLNVVALVVQLYRQQADLMGYINLVGCVVFGMFIVDPNKGV